MDGTELHRGRTDMRNSRALVMVRPHDGGEEGEESAQQTENRLLKLAYEDLQRSQALRGALKEEYYRQFSFEPKLNERSKKIGRRHSISELYRNEEGQRKLQDLIAAAEEEQAQECTFAPQINPRSAAIGRMRRPSLFEAPHHSEAAEQLRADKAVELRAAIERDEMKECTFTPAINREGPPMSLDPIVVPGLGRFLELKALAKKAEDEKLKRQEEVWNLRPKSSSGRIQRATVPQPFSFQARAQTGKPWQQPQKQQGGRGGGGG
eukprot:CAMPEP_0175057046 /NCGR_PEP_ID=MMETSP0052_2-20121109/11032_1 /TAXON_ID=51329 ORGANISM="Polytomella parva, Strain SAG 63-3" /NCGR_SAMPLE_ID=MMETSP0052_2 /ASSEMBLY_ACC=CAM_ASM_000194 /LENGTH=264 /DNA_ID=CAMNT_0016322187 /DNA_START=161 /DNA_END=952 /DNA_ORIENTATION=-